MNRTSSVGRSGTLDINAVSYALSVHKKVDPAEDEIDWNDVIHPRWAKEFTEEARSYITGATVTMPLGEVASGSLSFEIPIDRALEMLKTSQGADSRGTGWFRFNTGFKLRFGYLDIDGRFADGMNQQFLMRPTKADLTLGEVCTFKVSTMANVSWWAGVLTKEEKDSIPHQGDVVNAKDFLDWLVDHGKIAGWDINPQSKDIRYNEDWVAGKKLSYEELKSDSSLWETIRLYVLSKLGLCWWQVGFRPSVDEKTKGDIIFVLMPASERREMMRFHYRGVMDLQANPPSLPFENIAIKVPVWFYESEAVVQYRGIAADSKEEVTKATHRVSSGLAEELIATGRAGSIPPPSEKTSPSIKPIPLGGTDPAKAEQDGKNDTAWGVLNNYTADIDFGYLVPQLQAGDWVEVYGLGNSLYDGIYQIVEVRHTVISDWKTSVKLIRAEDWTQFFMQQKA